MQQNRAVFHLIGAGRQGLAGDGDPRGLEARLNAHRGRGVRHAGCGKAELVRSGVDVAHGAGSGDDARGGSRGVVQVEEQIVRSRREREARQHGQIRVKEIDEAAVQRDGLGVGNRIVEAGGDDVGSAAQNQRVGFAPRQMDGRGSLAGEAAHRFAAVRLGS